MAEQQSAGQQLAEYLLNMSLHFLIDNHYHNQCLNRKSYKYLLYIHSLCQQPVVYQHMKNWQQRLAGQQLLFMKEPRLQDQQRLVSLQDLAEQLQLMESQGLELQAFLPQFFLELGQQHQGWIQEDQAPECREQIVEVLNQLLIQLELIIPIKQIAMECNMFFFILMGEQQEEMILQDHNVYPIDFDMLVRSLNLLEHIQQCLPYLKFLQISIVVIQHEDLKDVTILPQLTQAINNILVVYMKVRMVDSFVEFHNCIMVMDDESDLPSYSEFVDMELQDSIEVVKSQHLIDRQRFDANQCQRHYLKKHLRVWMFLHTVLVLAFKKDVLNCLWNYIQVILLIPFLDCLVYMYRRVSCLII